MGTNYRPEFLTGESDSLEDGGRTKTSDIVTWLLDSDAAIPHQRAGEPSRRNTLRAMRVLRRWKGG